MSELSTEARRVLDAMLSGASHLRHWQSDIIMDVLPDDYELVGPGTKLEVVHDSIIRELKHAGLIKLAYVEVGYRVDPEQYFKQFSEKAQSGMADQLAGSSSMKLWNVHDHIPHGEWVVWAATAEAAMRIVIAEYNWSHPEELKAEQIVLDDKPGVLLYARECL